MPDFSLEQSATDQGQSPVCGVDEAGRGPWAGPVVAAAVILDRATLPDVLRDGLDDSKKLKARQREDLCAVLHATARFGVGVATVDEIDRMNILQATLLAMQRAVAGLGIVPGLALVDGNRPPVLACPVRTVVRGDGLSLSIAAASIVAKVTRDRIMADLAEQHPGYGWDHNAGYGTAEHSRALQSIGVTVHHRKSFAPIRKVLEAG